MLIAMAGLPGTGKSTLARRLASELGATILDKDSVRAALFDARDIEYSTAQDDFVLSVMLRVAAYVLRKDPARPIILDGRPFARRYQRADLDQFARAQGVPLRIIECVCSDATARLRLEHDASSGRHAAANRDYALYLSIKAGFEPIVEPHLVADTDDALDTCLALCLSFVRG